MELRVQVDDVRKKKLFVAAPMYGGMCAGMFCKSTNDLSALFRAHNIELKFYYLFNESLITRARNYCADEFMRSDSTHLLFIDSDIGFNAQDVLAMLAMIMAIQILITASLLISCAGLILRNVLAGKRSNRQ